MNTQHALVTDHCALNVFRCIKSNYVADDYSWEHVSSYMLSTLDACSTTSEVTTDGTLKILC